MQLCSLLCCVLSFVIFLVVILSVAHLIKTPQTDAYGNVAAYEMTPLDNDVLSWIVQEVLFPPNSLYITYNKTAPSDLHSCLSNTTWNLLGDGYILASTPSKQLTSQFKLYCDEGGFKGIYTTDTQQVVFDLSDSSLKEYVQKLQSTASYTVYINEENTITILSDLASGTRLVGSLDGSRFFTLEDGGSTISDEIPFDVYDTKLYTYNYFTYANLGKRCIGEIRDDSNLIVFLIESLLPTLTANDTYCDYYAVLCGSSFSFTIAASSPITVFGSLNDNSGRLYTTDNSLCGSFAFMTSDITDVLNYSLLRSTGNSVVGADTVEPHKHTTTLTTITNDAGHTHTVECNWDGNSDNKYYEAGGSITQWARRENDSDNELSTENSTSHTHDSGTTASAGGDKCHNHTITNSLGSAYVYIYHRTDATKPAIPSSIKFDANLVIQSLYNAIFPSGSVVISSSALPTLSNLNGWLHLNELGDFVLMTSYSIDKNIINNTGDMYYTQQHIITEDETPSHAHPTSDSATTKISHNHGNNTVPSSKTSTNRINPSTSDDGYNIASATKEAKTKRTLLSATVGEHTHEAIGESTPSEEPTTGHTHSLPYNYYSVHLYERI